MKKTIGVVLVCMLMLTTIPIAAGMQFEPETDEEETGGLFTRTIVRGIILGSSVNGRTTSFFALRVHYKTVNLFGQSCSGNFILQRVTFSGQFTGQMNRFFIIGSFRGTPK